MTTFSRAAPWALGTAAQRLAARSGPKPGVSSYPCAKAKRRTPLELWLILAYVIVTGIADLRAAKLGFQLGPIPLFFTDITLLLLLSASFLRWPSRVLYWGSEGTGAGPVGRAVWLVCILGLAYFMAAFARYRLHAAQDLAIWWYSVYFPLTYFAIRDSRDASKVLRCLTYAGAIGAVLMLFQQVTGVDLGLFSIQKRFILDRQILALRSGDANVFSVFSLVALSAYIVYERRLRKFHIVCALACFSSLISGEVRSGFLAVLVASAVILYQTKANYRARFLLLAALFAIPIIAAPKLPRALPGANLLQEFRISVLSAASGPGTDANSKFRIVRWRYATDLWAEHPLFGVGFGAPIIPSGLVDKSEASGEFNAGMPHNSFLMVAARTGLIGLALLLCPLALTLIPLFAKLRRTREADVLAAANLLAAMLTFANLGLFFERPGTNATFWIVMATAMHLV